MRINNVGTLKKNIEDILIEESNIGVYNMQINSFQNIVGDVAKYMTNGIRMPALYRLMNKISMYGHGENAGYINALSSVGKSCSLIIAIPLFLKGYELTYYLGDMDSIDTRTTRFQERSENKDVQSSWFFKYLDKGNTIPKDFIVGAIITDDNNEKEFALNSQYIGLKDEEYQAEFIERIVRKMDEAKRFNPYAYTVPRVNLNSREDIENQLLLLNGKLNYYEQGYKTFLEKQLELCKNK